MSDFHTLIRNNDSVSFFDWDAVAQRYPSPELLSRAIAEAVAQSEEGDVAAAFKNFGVLLVDLFDSAQYLSTFNSDPTLRAKLGVSMLRGLFVLSSINWALPDWKLAARFPMRKDVSAFAEAAYQEWGRKSGAFTALQADIQAGRNPLDRMTDKSIFIVDETGHFSRM